MPAKIPYRIMLIAMLITGLISCSSKGSEPQGPPEEWNERAIFSYAHDEDAHYEFTLEQDGYEYRATFEDFMDTMIFQDDAKIEWSNSGDDTWQLVTRVGPDVHHFRLRKAVTPKGVEGVDVLNWSMNNYELEDGHKTVSVAKLLNSKEWQEYAKATGQ